MHYRCEDLKYSESEDLIMPSRTRNEFRDLMKVLMFFYRCEDLIFRIRRPDNAIPDKERVSGSYEGTDVLLSV